MFSIRDIFYWEIENKWLLNLWIVKTSEAHNSLAHK